MLAQYRKGRKLKLTVGPAWSTFDEEGPARQVLFWSGGKDSFLALRALQRENKAGEDERITLLTTFERSSGTIPFQGTQARIRFAFGSCILLMSSSPQLH